MIYQKIKTIIIALFFVFLALPVNAAELKFDKASIKSDVEQTFEARLVLDTESQFINAIEGKVFFPADILELQEIRNGNSVINLWIEQPKISENCTDFCEIVFSGITPGGYSGNDGFIFSLIFKTKGEGSGKIELADVRTLLNDGSGTEAAITKKDYSVNIFEGGPILEPPILEDSIPPEAFSPVVEQDDNIFDGKLFLIFDTTDKQSGIAYYEVQETKKRSPQPEKWKKAESPYLLEDQKAKGYIFVKAVDNNGNERIEIVKPRIIPLYQIIFISVIIIVGIYIVFRKIYDRKK